MRRPACRPDVPTDSALCTELQDPRQRLLGRGRRRATWARPPGIPTFLLVDHTVDPLGATGPVAGSASGVPLLHRQHAVRERRRPAHRPAALRVHVGRRAAPTSATTASSTRRQVEEKGDYRGLVVLRAVVRPAPTAAASRSRSRSRWPKGRQELATDYRTDYGRVPVGRPLGGGRCCREYPSLDNAFAIQVALRGHLRAERRRWPELADERPRPRDARSGRRWARRTISRATAATRSDRAR